MDVLKNFAGRQLQCENNGEYVTFPYNGRKVWLRKRCIDQYTSDKYIELIKEINLGHK